MNKQNRIISVGMKLLTIYYIIWIIFALVFKMSFTINDILVSRQANFIPYYYDKSSDINLVLEEMRLNILVFIPLGIMFRSMLFDRESINTILLVFIFSVIIETLQYILSIGIFDITDIINNTLGGFFGVLIYNAIVKNKPKYKVDKFIFIIFLLAAILLTILFIIVYLNN